MHCWPFVAPQCTELPCYRRLIDLISELMAATAFVKQNEFSETLIPMFRNTSRTMFMAFLVSLVGLMFLNCVLCFFVFFW